MKIAAEQLETGGYHTVQGKAVGTIDWTPISKTVNRTVVLCTSTYKNGLRTIRDANTKKGAFTQEEVLYAIYFCSYMYYIISFYLSIH